MPITRVVVVDLDGVKEFFADEWTVVVQDQGRTLKLFPKGCGTQARDERNANLIQDFANESKTLDKGE